MGPDHNSARAATRSDRADLASVIMSNYTDKLQEKLRLSGAFAGAGDDNKFLRLAKMSKADLIELCLRLASPLVECCDDENLCYDEVLKEYRILKNLGII